MKDKLVKLRKIFIERDLMFICNCIYFLELPPNEIEELRGYLEKHKPKRIPYNNGGGWFKCYDKQARINFLDKLIDNTN